MILNIKNLKQLILLIKDKKINQFNLKYTNLNILINKKPFQASKLKKINTLTHFENAYQKIIESRHNSTHIDITKTKNKIKKNDDSEIYSIIVSPMVGTFYRSPAPNEQPFIKIHDIVQKRQTVCIVEAMKLMNEIESEVNGEIMEILVNDGDIVDCGQALIKVKTG